MRRIAAALIVLAISPLTARQPSFKSTTELVTVPVAVTNVTRDKLITGGLTAADFRVFEDGVPQQISLLSQDRRPTSRARDDRQGVQSATGDPDHQRRLREHQCDLGIPRGQDPRAERGARLCVWSLRPAELAPGGVYLSITSLSDAAAAGLTLLHEFKYQYTLAYTPSKPLDGTYRRIKVEIAVPDLLVRHRGGYLALPAGAKP